jgi:integrase
VAIRTEKGGFEITAYVPIGPDFIEAIERGPVGDQVFIIGESGKPLTKETFGNMFRAACNQAGVNKSAHGLRKWAATQLAEMGLSEAELESLFGWVRGSGMAAHYSKQAARKQLARGVRDRMAEPKQSHPDAARSHLKKDD